MNADVRSNGAAVAEYRRKAAVWREDAADYKRQGKPREAATAEFWANTNVDCAELARLGVTDIDIQEVARRRDDRPPPLVRHADELLPDLATASFFIDWPAFWQHDHGEQEWIFEPILARGRGHAIYAKHKTGKSLLLLWIASTLATTRSDVIVLYLDYEMCEDDLHERLVDMGYDEDADLSRLRYALLPSLPPLDRHGTGPTALYELVDAEQAAHPSAHVVVLIDTLGRAVVGAENDADTYRAFWTHTGIGLKRRGVTFARTDHEGKNPEAGQRGSSAKGDDVDVNWRLVPGDEGGLILKRDSARMSWVPEKVGLVRLEDPLRYGRALTPTPPGTKACADELDLVGVPVDVSFRQARALAKEHGITASSVVLNAAVKYRKERPAGGGTPHGTPHGDEGGTA
jgi:hypothetical protein